MSSASQPLWWQTGVIYQVYPRSFQDSTGNGIGDLAGIIHRLDYLSNTLGIDAVWLSPFYPSPMADFGYDVADYCGVDPLFGDLQIFERLVERLHSRGLKLIIDLVPNHTSDQHPWFVQARASRENPKRDWYVWTDPRPDGSPPNNWLSMFGGPAWEWESATGQYFLHSFLKEQPDLNWRNPQVEEAIFDVVRFWLELGVDGFRIDVAHYIMKDPELRDNPLNPQRGPSAHRPLGDYDSQVHLYDKGHSDVHGVYRRFRRLLDAYNARQPRVSIGEIHIFDWEQWASYYGRHLDELHMPFNFQLLNVPWHAASVRRVVDALEAVLPPGAWPNYVLGNHDESRLATRLAPTQARIAAMLLLTLRGTPTLYYGDEIGMTDVPILPSQQQDPWGRRVPGLTRDPCRTPMQWSPAANAGFSPPATPATWLPLAGNWQTLNVERQLADPGSLLNLYRRLLALRKASPALQFGDYQAVDGIPEDCYVYTRRTADQHLLIALNFSAQEHRLTLPVLRDRTIRLSTHVDREGILRAQDLPLRAGEGVIVEIDHA